MENFVLTGLREVGKTVLLDTFKPIAIEQGWLWVGTDLSESTSEMSKKLLAKPFSASHVNQILAALSEVGLVYKNRHGRYSFAVPLLGRFILRQHEE